ncbi:hypothetical protein PR048_004980 [Dryococelus australis]|uniref:Uncharacterized protein n=1 Tax=Dryococelus australis TaxID=614101 RepID=A0ABQ9I6Z4_9NEOP|nr:hypothetical protein PR048_004980 [Dryococelus australis]
MAEHLRRVPSQWSKCHYLCKTIQNDDLQKAKYYSVNLNCTPDVNHTEQMTMVVRFVQAEKNEDISLREHFLVIRRRGTHEKFS